MAARVLSMKKQQEVQRLKKLGLSERKISKALGISRNTIKKYEGELVEESGCTPEWVEKVNWQEISKEISNGISLQVLWEELAEQKVINVGYSGFWKQFHKKYPNLAVSLHREFPCGERAEVDYAGSGIDILNPITGELIKTELFVGVLCFSKYIYAEFSFSQKLSDWISSHMRMFEYWGGVPKYICSDNLKSGVKKAHLYDPDANPTYTEMASHYELAIIPARPYKAKDKADVERTVQIIQRWFYAKIRHKTFTSLTELNQCLRQHLKILNGKIHKRFKISRSQKFEVEQQSLKALPSYPYEIAIYHKAKLHPDCHLVFEGNFYSAPHDLRGKVLNIRATPKSLEIYDEGQRVAFHPRKMDPKGTYITHKPHYPASHQAYFEETPQRLLELSSAIGPHTHTLIKGLLEDPYPLRYLRRCQGIVRLASAYGRDALEKSCLLALNLSRPTYLFIEKVLKRKTYEHKEDKKTIQRNENENLRGLAYFH